MEFPCSVHKDSYENSKIAIDEQELKEFNQDGWLISEEFLNPESIAKNRGRPAKSEDS